MNSRVLIEIFVNSSYYGQCEGAVAFSFEPQAGDSIDFGVSPEGVPADALLLQVESRVIYPESKASSVAALLNFDHLVLESEDHAFKVTRWLEENFMLNFWKA